MELQSIKKIGAKTIPLLNKLNIFTPKDLIDYYPYRYIVYKPTHLKDAVEDSVVTVLATVESTPKISYIRRNFNSLNFKALASERIINVSIFNRGFLYSKLEVGKNITLIGKYDQKKNRFIANDIKLSWMSNLKIEPIYHVVKGLKNSQIHDFIAEAISKEETIDYIPKSFIESYKFIDKKQALQWIHFPKNVNEIKQARMRLIYEEFFLFMLKINYLKLQSKKVKGIQKSFDLKQIQAFVHALPFSLTSDQEKAMQEVLKDLKSDAKMNRLIQGDVGSGKTVIATIAMYATFLGGFQSALMAPTEILVTQHYENIKHLLEPFHVQVALLVGSLKKKEHNEIVKALSEGKIDVLIGTHALISQDVAFKNLGLVVTDEQHRFGVNQRSNLQNKGKLPDVIYMSATPIPRTYALTIYQDMSTSIIKTKPSGRKEIQTFVKKESELKSILQHVYEEIKKGHQIYVVAPSILENETSNDVLNLKKNFDVAFNGKVKTGILHGKLKAQEKEEIIRLFQENEIKILIATTVIEVGVDVHNATMILIFNAEMFGLATLHQLRGRVGRNDLQSFCYLISNTDTERLKVLEASNDGFYISEQDFLMRKEGDLFGTKQSGDLFFKIGDIKKDFKILMQTKKDSEQFLESKEVEELKYKAILKDIEIVD